MKFLTNFFIYSTTSIVCLTIINFFYKIIYFQNFELENTIVKSILLTFILNTTIAVIVLYSSFLVSLFLYKKKENDYLKFFISFPHISFAIGILFFFSSSGFLQRVLNLFRQDDIPISNYLENFEYSILYIFSLTIRELPFMVMLGLSSLNKIKTNQLLLNSKNLKLNDFNCYNLIVFPIWLRQMYLPLIIIISFTYSNLEYSYILGTQFPELLNQIIINYWGKYFYLNDARIYNLTIFIVISLIMSLLTLYGIDKTRGFVFWKLRKFLPNLELIFMGKVLYWLVNITFFINIATLIIYSFTDNWYYPDLLPKSFTYSNYYQIILLGLDSFLFSIIISFALSIGVFFIIFIFFTNLNTTHDKFIKKLFLVTIILILIIPQNIFIISYNSLINIFNINNIFFPYIISLYLYIIPYVYYILKERLENEYFKTLMIARVNHKLTNYKLLSKIIYPIYKDVFWFSIMIGFSVCYYQFIQSVIIGNGKYTLFNNEVMILFSGESIHLASAGAIVNLVPCLILFMFYKKNNVRT